MDAHILFPYIFMKTSPNPTAMITRMIVPIGVNEQCALYPSIHALLADSSGTTVITADTAEAIVAESNNKNSSNFPNNEIISLNNNYHPSFL